MEPPADCVSCSFRWSCGNSQPDQNTQNAMCTYSVLGTHTATLTANDNDADCPKEGTDTVEITVVP